MTRTYAKLRAKPCNQYGKNENRASDEPQGSPSNSPWLRREGVAKPDHNELGAEYGKVSSAGRDVDSRETPFSFGDPTTCARRIAVCSMESSVLHWEAGGMTR
jgi:hypothetical protein